MRGVAPHGARFSSALGEDDLHAPWLLGISWWSVALPGLLFAILVGVGAILGGRLTAPDSGSAELTPALRTAVPTLALGGQAGSNPITPTATLFLPTLTQPPPPTETPTATATPGPCEQVVQTGDTLISLASRCGHRDLAVLDQIVELNGLRSAESIQLGQRILIPWPSPTPGADEEGALPDGASEGGGNGLVIAEVIPTVTLQPGVMWYTIQPGDDVIGIAYQHNANVEILAQLNPQITFSQCDFGLDTGGPNCSVALVAGQQIRVPAPSPTPTLSPTPSGSETATPTPTPTFNAPSLLSPGDRELFGAGELITLRWVTTGVLADTDAYLVTVTDTTAGVIYTETTRETFYLVPAEWQPADGRHAFTWQIAVGPLSPGGGLAAITFSTPSRLFFWDNR